MKKMILSCFLLFFSVIPASAQNAKFKALYIYNFTKYINWQTSTRQNTFIIGVLGNSDIIEELKIIAQKRKINDMNIVVKRFRSTNDIQFCHILYIPAQKNIQLNNLSQHIEKNMLIITDLSGFKESAINFLLENGAILYEINLNNFAPVGLSYSQSLIKLAARVNQ